MAPPSASWIVLMTTIVSVTAENILARPGEDVTLQCQASAVTENTKIMWTRSDLGSDDYVFFFRDNRLYESYQHESYRGRVHLKDPDLKAGDASVILRNVSVKDSGRYECKVNGDKKATTLKSVDLQVIQPENVSATSGEDVTLHCQAPGVSDITNIVWTRSDLGSDDYVFFFRDNRLYESYQHESYRGRVHLKDPELKAGDASLILRNVKVKDSGTYECEVNGDAGRRRKRAAPVLSSVYLQVTPGVEVVDQTGGGVDRGHSGLMAAGMLVGLLVSVVGVVGVGVLLWRKKNQRAAQPAAPEEVPLPTI